MSKIFISYRREDSGYVAGLLADKLIAKYGQNSVFIDVDNIPLGVDFRHYINDAVGQCDVLLAIIGDSWLSVKSESNERRIDNPADYVRLEISAALQRNIPVIPVLTNNARMPIERDLPDELKPIVYRNATELRSGRDLRHHIDVLINGIKLVPKRSQSSSEEQPATPPTNQQTEKGYSQARSTKIQDQKAPSKKSNIEIRTEALGYAMGKAIAPHLGIIIPLGIGIILVIVIIIITMVNA